MNKCAREMNLNPITGVCYHTLLIVERCDTDGLGYRYLVRRIQEHGFCYRIEMDALRTARVGRRLPSLKHVQMSRISC
jgi:hypothetical protein